MRRVLSDFLVRLGDDQELAAEYASDRVATLERHGVSGQDREAILANDLPALRDRLRTEHPDIKIFNLVTRPGSEPNPGTPPPKPPKPKPRPK
jgi:hypothetical protein